jgi:hypothetical protein
MQREKGNDRAGDESGQKTNQNGINEESSPKTEYLIDAIEIVAGLVFGGIAIALDAAGFHTLSLIFGFLAVVCGLAIAAHLLQKFGLKYIKTGFVVTLITMALLFGFLATHEPAPEPKPHPHFTFSVMVDNNPDHEIQLTNSFFVFNSYYKNTVPSGELFVSLKPGQSNILLNFGVKNNSSVTAEYIDITVSLPENLGCIADDRWNKAKLDALDVSKFGNPIIMESWGDSLPALLPGSWAVLSGIKIPQIKEQQQILVLIMARSKDSPAESIAFILKFMPTSFFQKKRIMSFHNEKFMPISRM